MKKFFYCTFYLVSLVLVSVTWSFFDTSEQSNLIMDIGVRDGTIKEQLNWISFDKVTDSDPINDVIRIFIKSELSNFVEIPTDVNDYEISIYNPNNKNYLIRGGIWEMDDAFLFLDAKKEYSKKISKIDFRYLTELLNLVN